MTLTNKIAEEFLADPKKVDLSGIRGVSEQLDSKLLNKIVLIWRKRVLEDFKRTGFQEPSEWVNGRIVLPPPAKPLSGKGYARVQIWDPNPEYRSSWWLPRPLLNWFILKLADDHKCKGRISPEAERLLLDKAKCWFWIFNNDKPKTDAPAEWVNGEIVLPPLTSNAIWRTQTRMSKWYEIPTSFYNWYVSLLPTEHVKKTSGYDRDFFEISDIAAELLIANRDFFESVRKLKRAQILEDQNEKLQNVAESAGSSREELKAKFNKLAGLVKGGNFQLVADILAGAESPWLYEALLLGASLTPDGELKPGKPLRLFKEHADFVFLLVLAFMPEGLELDSSLHREAKIQAKLSDDSVGIVLQKIADRLPGLDIDGCPELFRFSYMLADLLRMTSHLSESARRALESPYAWEKIGVQWNMMRNGFRTNVEVWQRDWGIAKANECICESLIEKKADA
jgi:predicted DNA-binding protein YlxM (UPF0122 family)